MSEASQVMTCADCGAPFPIPAAVSFAAGYSTTTVPRYTEKHLRSIDAEDATPDVRLFPAFYNVEGHQRAQVATEPRRICYACSALLESETMTATGRGILYLTEREWKPGDPWRGHLFAKNTMAGLRRYTYHLTNWPGSADFALSGIVKESWGRGFGQRYPVRTFRFRGPDGYIWSGRSAGDMQLARCRRTKQRIDTKTLPVRCAICGEESPDRGSMAGSVHRWGPRDHDFTPATGDPR